MELTESIESINQHLIDMFGIDTITGQPIWRVVWSEDQFEYRLGTYDDYSDGGIYLRTVTEVRWVPKYRQWVPEKYVLERLVVVPVMNSDEIPDTKVSYEPLYVFEDKNGNYLPPKFEACEFVIKLIYSVQYGDKSVARYKDPEDSVEASLEIKRKRIDKIQEELFGDESGLLGTTITGETIIVPQNYKKES